MVNFKRCEFEFVDSVLDMLVNNFNICFEFKQNNFAVLCTTCYYLKYYFQNRPLFEVNKGNHLQTMNYKDLLNSLGLSSNYINRLVKCYERYIIETSCDVAPYYNSVIKPLYINFNKSKLIELLSLNISDVDFLILNGILKPDMSVKLIRRLIKKYKNGTLNDKENVDSDTDTEFENIPDTFNFINDYTFDYFAQLPKTQLIDISWQLYQVIKKKKQGK